MIIQVIETCYAHVIEQNRYSEIDKREKVVAFQHFFVSSMFTIIIN